MKLDRDCMRDVLLTLEDNLNYSALEDGLLSRKVIWLENLCSLLPDYRKEDVFYSVKMLDEAGYIRANIQWASGGVYSCGVTDMTYLGHDFLDKIRDPERWTRVKTVLSGIRDYSLSAISAVAEGVTEGAIHAYFATKR